MSLKETLELRDKELLRDIKDIIISASNFTEVPKDYDIGEQSNNITIKEIQREALRKIL